VGPTMPGLAAVVEGEAAARRRLIGFRQELFDCLRRRADTLFELVDAVLTAPGRVTSLVQLAEEAAFRRGHGALFDALACGDIDLEGLGGLLARSWEPAGPGPLKIAVDVSPWPRPHAETSAERCNCYHSCRCRGTGKTVPGWPYSFAAGLEWGATSWTALLDTVRLGPDDDATTVTTAQVARVTAALDAAGHLTGRPAPLFVFDAGYDPTRISWLADQQGLDVQVLARVRSDRVYHAKPVQRPRHLGGRPRRYGARLALADPATWPEPDETRTSTNPRYGKVTVQAWHEHHQQLDRYRGWKHHTGELPVVPGTLILIQAEHLPGGRTPKPMWLWHHAPQDTALDLDLLWTAYLRRFDIEHTFKTIKQWLGWTCPQIRTPAQADRWTQLILAAHTQLRLARTLTTDLRHPWEKPPAPGKPPTPGRVRRGFPRLRRQLGTPASKPKPTRPGPGRPQGTTRPPRTRHPPGKTINPTKT
jgi:hypothetical protein